MSARIDHAAQAEKLDQNAWQMGGPFGDQLIRTHEQRQDMILSAQVHATLALVEQQRIANLIALGQLRIGPLEAPVFRHLVLEPRGELDVAPVAEIREALGLS